MKYHLNERGEAKLCRASTAPCPLGAEHFASKEAAAAQYESQMSVFTTASKAVKEASSFVQTEVEPYMEEIEFDDNGAVEENYCTLDEMANPKKALNNCFSASSQVIEEFSQLASLQEARMELKSVTFNDGTAHHAILFTPSKAGETSEKPAVIDYTARQYDPALPFPVVLDEPAWEDLVARKALDKFHIRMEQQDWSTPEAVARGLELRYPGVTVDLRLSQGDYVVLHGIKLDKQHRGQGTGTAVMEDLVKLADERNWPLALTPSTDWGASSTARLERFYKRFGFVPNKGCNKDFLTMESMIRPAATGK